MCRWFRRSIVVEGDRQRVVSFDRDWIQRIRYVLDIRLGDKRTIAPCAVSVTPREGIELLLILESTAPAHDDVGVPLQVRAALVVLHVETEVGLHTGIPRVGARGGAVHQQTASCD